MTTPERLRRRQRFEGSALLLLGVFTILVSIYFRAQDVEQQRCFAAFLAADNTTSTVRSDLVERESLATRAVITRALTAESREGIESAYAAYTTSLDRIDQLRKDNPVRNFSEGDCG